ncbi:MAG: N-6 DNA methylase [Candidatus Heimdallarchaeota archaeon]|nr:N-6 DNA methylase [Candidatus Heimdallarchaeota archaeon]
MNNKDSSFYPIRLITKASTYFKNPNILWLYIFHNLIKLTDKENHFLAFFNNSSLEVLSSDNSSEHDITINIDIPFSLDENLSSTHLTPFHLSSIDCTIHSLKGKGQFFTPMYISEYIAKQSLHYFIKKRGLESLPQASIADIACGSGNLLLPILYALRNIYGEERNISDYISKNLFGFDLDPVALNICKLRIFMFLSLFFPDSTLPNISTNIVPGNALLDKSLNFASELEYFTQPIPFFLKSYKPSIQFDIIVSNPPFMCYGLRGAQRYNQDYKNFLRENYSSAEYKLSMYPIFIERSLRLLKNKGILGIITPDSFLLGRYYSKIRSFILNNSRILEINLLGFEPFKQATVGRPVISFYQQTADGRENGSEQMFKANWIATKDIFVKGNWDSHSNYQKQFYNNPVDRFQLFFNSDEEKFAKLWMNSTDLKMEDIVTIHTGIRSKVGQKNIISNLNNGKYWKKGIISSSQVLPFQVEYKGNWINTNPEILWSGGFNSEIIENPKILIRQTGYRIITAVDEEGYYHLNNVHSISMKDDSINIFALSSLLNSSDFNKLYNILSLENGRALAQIDIDFLLKMPIPRLTKQDEEVLKDFYFTTQQNYRLNKSCSSYSLENVLNRKIP